jgi:uncharacterized RDD family membrane protein YckC
MSAKLYPNAEKPAVPAGLFRRLFAAFYDGLLLFALSFVLGAIAIGINVQISGDHLLPGWVGSTLLLITCFLFYGWFWTHGGQTLGMRTWRLQVLDENEQCIGWGAAAIRFCAAGVSWLAFGLGWLWVYLDRDKRTWHDMVSKSRVVFFPKN